MKNGGAHEGQFPELCIGNSGNRLGVGNNARVCHENAGNIRPVLVDIGAGGSGRKSACYVASAPAHNLYLSSGETAVESGDYYLSEFRERLFDGNGNSGGVKGPVVIHKDAF